MTSTFNEHEHPRSEDDGKFVEKLGGSPELAISQEQVLDDLDQEREQQFMGVCPDCGKSIGPAHSADAIMAKGAEHAAETPEQQAADGDYDKVETDEHHQRFTKKGLLNRKNGPAVRVIDSRDGSGLWYKDGKLSRHGGPAVADGSNPLDDEWWVEGEQIELTGSDERALATHIQKSLASLDAAFLENGVKTERNRARDEFTAQVAAHVARRALLDERTRGE